MRRIAMRIAFMLLVSLTLMWSVGQIFRDASPITALCFYVPSPALALAWIFVFVVAIRRKRRRWACAAIAVAIFPVAIIILRENAFWRASSPMHTQTSRALRLVHWNVYRGHLGWDKLQQRLADEQADFYLLSEIPTKASLDELTRLRPDACEAQWFRIGSMAVWGRGTIDDLGWVVKSREAKVHLVRWHSPRGELTILAVDLISDPLVHRDPLLRDLRRIIDEHRPDIIAGDFNAPRESLGLSTLPSGYRHAYWTAGSGWGYTWPVPVSAYAIDQCICGERVTPIDYRLQSSRLSDHRLQTVEFEVRGGDDIRVSEHESAEQLK